MGARKAVHHGKRGTSYLELRSYWIEEELGGLGKKRRSQETTRIVRYMQGRGPFNNTSLKAANHEGQVKDRAGVSGEGAG